MTSKTTDKLSSEVRARAVRMVLDHEGEHAWRWAAVSSIAAKIGCTAQTLDEWVKKAERDRGARAGVPTDVATKLKALERENRELRQANEILCKASAYFTQAELDYYAKLDQPGAVQFRRGRESFRISQEGVHPDGAFYCVGPGPYSMRRFRPGFKDQPSASIACWIAPRGTLNGPL